MTFYQSERFDDHARHHLHESPWTMTLPLWVLAIGSIVVGWVGIPQALGGSNHWHHWLLPVLMDIPGSVPAYGHGTEAALAGVSVLWAVVAIGLAFKVYFRENALPGRMAAALGPLYHGSLNKWYLDEIYDALIVNPIKKLTSVSDFFDRWVIDGFVNLVRHVTIGVSVVSKVFDLGFVDGLVNLVAATIRGFGAAFRRFQTGSLQNYATYFIFGLFLMVCAFLLGRPGL